MNNRVDFLPQDISLLLRKQIKWLMARQVLLRAKKNQDISILVSVNTYHEISRGNFYTVGEGPNLHSLASPSLAVDHRAFYQ
jgi:hypothetical protein